MNYMMYSIGIVCSGAHVFYSKLQPFTLLYHRSVSMPVCTLMPILASKM